MSDTTGAPGVGETPVVPGGVLLGVAPVVSCGRSRELLERAGLLPVGVGQMAVLVGVDVSRLNQPDRLSFLLLWQQSLNWVQAQQFRAVAAAAGQARVPDRDMPSDGQRESLSGSVAEDSRLAEIGATLRITPLAAQRLVGVARTAVTTVEPVLEGMLCGEWNIGHLRRAVDAVEFHDAALAREATVAAVGQGFRGSPSDVKRRIQRELVRLDSVAVGERIKAKRRSRGVTLWAHDDLVGELSVVGSWVSLNSTFRQLSRRAEQVLESLREYRRSHPGVTLCCPDAVNRALVELRAEQSPPGGLTTAARGDEAAHQFTPSSTSVSTSVATSAATAGSRPAFVSPPVSTTTASAPVSTATSTSTQTSGTTSVSGAGLAVVVPCASCGSTSTDLPSLDQLRADALVEAGDLLAAQMQSETGVDVEQLCARRGARWRHAVVVSDLATALGVADEPGWVPGYGYVPAELSRQLLADAGAWRRFLLDDQGRVAGVGKYGYRPSVRLRELVTARDVTCTFPGCGRSAASADLDHRVNFDGSNTHPENLHALCRTHHRLKTYAGWEVRRDREGVDHWRSPTGRHYTDQQPTPPWPTIGRSVPGSSTPQAYRVSRVHVTLPASRFSHTHPCPYVFGCACACASGQQASSDHASGHQASSDHAQGVSTHATGSTVSMCAACCSNRSHTPWATNRFSRFTRATCTAAPFLIPTHQTWAPGHLTLDNLAQSAGGRTHNPARPINGPPHPQNPRTTIT